MSCVVISISLVSSFAYSNIRAPYSVVNTGKTNVGFRGNERSPYPQIPCTKLKMWPFDEENPSTKSENSPRKKENPANASINDSSNQSNPFLPFLDFIPVQEYKVIENADLSNDNLGPLLPVAEKIDELTGGWGLTYADLKPETPTTPTGIAFLATNLGYALAGGLLTLHGDIVFGTLTELAGAVSLWYHYSQLQFGQDRSEVRLALLTDYIFASAALITGGAYLVSMGVQSVPVSCILLGGSSVVALTLSWVWEFGLPYIFWHSTWHILSALTGYFIGQAHIANAAGL